jgi:L-aminopeptidase/D-esterase-like protein
VNQNDTITAIKGISVGHYTDLGNLTGCSVIRFPPNGAIAGVDVRGSAPGTRETDLLNPTNLVERIHALVLGGGSAFGLDAASGVMKCLEEDGIGLDTGSEIKVPIVPAAVLYDLSVGNSKVRPNDAWGYIACKEAEKMPVMQGNVGAGSGATVGKIMGMDKAMKAGLGSYAITLPNGVIVAALCIVNAVGDIINPKTGKIVAGARASKKGLFLNSSEYLKEKSISSIFTGSNTTIAVVATNAKFTKTQLSKIASMAHDGIARAINPSHTMFDGDTIFAVSVPSEDETTSIGVTVAGSIAADTLVESILRGVKSAESIAEFPSSSEWKT